MIIDRFEFCVIQLKHPMVDDLFSANKNTIQYRFNFSENYLYSFQNDEQRKPQNNYNKCKNDSRYRRPQYSKHFKILKIINNCAIHINKYAIHYNSGSDSCIKSESLIIRQHLENGCNDLLHEKRSIICFSFLKNVFVQ